MGLRAAREPAREHVTLTQASLDGRAVLCTQGLGAVTHLGDAAVRGQPALDNLRFEGADRPELANTLDVVQQGVVDGVQRLGELQLGACQRVGS